MDAVNECTKDETVEDIQWFYSKSKVPICLAITDLIHLLNTLKEACILSEEEALELQGDTRTGHRVVYECLCWIEDKEISLKYFFELLFRKSFLKKYPDLKPLHAEYQEGKYQHGIHSTTDQDKDPQIFAKEKVKICLAITDRFPFLHGLQDLTILSESESLKLQADERPVSRVIYESLSLIEKKDLKLNVVFEYIFQESYLKLYPGLQDILREPSGQFVAPFNGEQYPKFNIATDLPEFFKHNEPYICKAVKDLFPFLHGLHDYGLLAYIEMLKLQADKRPITDVLHDALSHIQTISDMKNFFAYVLQEFYVKLYPDLHITLNSLNAALKLDVCPPSPVSSTEKIPETQDSNIHFTVIVNNEIMELSELNSIEPSTVVPQDEILEIPEQDSSEPFPGSDDVLPVRKCKLQPISYCDPPDLDWEANKRKTHKGSDDTLPPSVRKCRLQPISYSEPPDLICEVNSREKKHKAPENSKQHKFQKRRTQETRKCSLNSEVKYESGQVIKPVTVRLEFPKQVFNEEFRVRCGDKTGIFQKEHWSGNSTKDLCIRSEGKKFSVTQFEKYGGKGTHKNWKKSIQCEEIRLECLFKAGILKRPRTKKGRCSDPEQYSVRIKRVHSLAVTTSG